MIKRLVKQVMFACFPKWATKYFSARARAHSHRVVQQWGCPEINAKLIQHLGAQVQEGPFAGLKLSPMTQAEHLGPYLLGTYESELDAAWETVLQKKYQQIIDVGSKFGFYAVGLARRYPQAEVVAFDTDWWAREATEEMAKANQVHNVRVLGFCDSTWLDRHLQEGAFLISDCEGYEGELLASKPIRHLASATLIIEFHDQFVPGVSERLRKLFESTHHIQIIQTTEQRRETTRNLSFLTEDQSKLAKTEVRDPQSWMLCLPKTTVA